MGDPLVFHKHCRAVKWHLQEVTGELMLLPKSNGVWVTLKDAMDHLVVRMLIGGHTTGTNLNVAFF